MLLRTTSGSWVFNNSLGSTTSQKSFCRQLNRDGRLWKFGGGERRFRIEPLKLAHSPGQVRISMHDHWTFGSLVQINLIEDTVFSEVITKDQLSHLCTVLTFCFNRDAISLLDLAS